MSYNPLYEASKALPVEHIAKELEDFDAAGRDLSRRRFSRSPPTIPSDASTKYEESEPPSALAQLHDKEIMELRNSTAGAQFRIQVRDELGRIHAARDKGLLQQSGLSDWQEAAEANVKYRWMQQGIWDKQWARQHGKIWKHESQLSLLPAKPSNPIKSGGVARPGTKRKRQSSDLEEEYEEIVRCAVEYQTQQSSRPCYQFLYQFCKEREWIKMGLSEPDHDPHTNLDTRAYENVKSRWVRDGVWDDDWISIPGTSWRHERPPKFPSAYEEFQKADARKAAIMEQAERPPRWYFMAPAEPERIITRPFSPSRSPEIATNPPSPGILNPVLPVTPDRRDPSTTLRTPNEMGFLPSKRKSTVKTKGKTKDRPKFQDQHRRQTKGAAEKATVTALKPIRTNPTEKSPRKQKFTTEKACATKPRSVKKRPSADNEKTHPPISVANKNKMVAGATASRPRRAAAVKAMHDITKSIKQ